MKQGATLEQWVRRICADGFGEKVFNDKSLAGVRRQIILIGMIAYNQGVTDCAKDALANFKPGRK